MSYTFLGEIRVFPYNFAPSGWALCNGQLLPIAQYSALFSLIGTFYGGNGTSNFALPNLEGRVAIHAGQGAGLQSYTQGEQGGGVTVTLPAVQMPSHVHSVMAEPVPGTVASPAGALWAEPNVGRAQVPTYSNVTASPLQLNANTFAAAGGGQPHENEPPLLVFNFCIALQGIFPARN